MSSAEVNVVIGALIVKTLSKLIANMSFLFQKHFSEKMTWHFM